MGGRMGGRKLTCSRSGRSSPPGGPSQPAHNQQQQQSLLVVIHVTGLVWLVWLVWSGLRCGGAIKAQGRPEAAYLAGAAHTALLAFLPGGAPARSEFLQQPNQNDCRASVM